MIRSFLAPNPSPMTYEGTRTYVVGHERPAVIDPGPDDPRHLDVIVDALAGRTPAAILLTHSHADHSAGAPTLAERTGAPILLHPGGMALPFPPRAITRWLADGDVIETDAGRLRAVHTPGHCPDHVVFLLDGEDAPERALFAGDLFIGGMDTTLVAPPEGQLTAYLASLETVRALAPSVIHPAHGPSMGDPEAVIARYAAHRQARIAQVVRALREGGPARPGDLVDRVYGTALHPGLRGAAEGSLHAILDHLATLGRIERSEGGWTLLPDQSESR